jgi:hypothetical protein
MQDSSPFRWQTQTGNIITQGGRTITPRSQVLALRLPVANLSFLWHRPVSVEVREEDGSQYVLPVIDITRQGLWIILGLGFIGSLLIRRFYHD